jgi:hypothetical protein
MRAKILSTWQLGKVLRFFDFNFFWLDRDVRWQRPALVVADNEG